MYPLQYAIGVDIGGGSAKFGIVSSSGDIIFKYSIPTPVCEHPETVANDYAQGIEVLIEHCRESAIHPVGIGVGIPGHLSENRRIPIFSNVHTLDNFRLADFLSEHFQLSVQLDNDATLAAIAEYHFGAGRNVKRLLVMTVGTGIGAGVIVDGTPQRPIRGCIGDPGHIIVLPESRWRCGCGCRGCLETVASSLAIEREAAALAHRFPESDMAKLQDDEGSLSAAEVIRAARAGDKHARQILEQSGRWLGIGLVSWCYVFDPSVILIGGGVSAAGELLLSPIRRKMQEIGMPQYVRDARIALAGLGNDAGIIGAASLFFYPDQKDTHT